MNVVLRNFIISIVTVVIGGLALWSSEEASGGVNVPWLLLVGFAAGCVALTFMTWWKRRSLPNEVGRKKGRGK